MNIYQKILEARKEIEYLKKDGKVDFGKTSYKAITDEKVMCTVRPILDKHGIVMTIEQIQMSREGNITEGVVTWRITNVDDPQDYILIQSAGQGSDTQDKGAGKMMTYSRKYALLNTLLIPTGEDPDKISSEELDAQQNEDEIGKWRGKLLDLTGGDVERINAFLARAIKSKPTFDDLTLEQLQGVYEILENKLKKETNHE